MMFRFLNHHQVYFFTGIEASEIALYCSSFSENQESKNKKHLEFKKRLIEIVKFLPVFKIFEKQKQIQQSTYLPSIDNKAFPT